MASFSISGGAVYVGPSSSLLTRRLSSSRRSRTVVCIGWIRRGYLVRLREGTSRDWSSREGLRRTPTPWRTSDGRSEKNSVCAPRKDRFGVVPETDAGLTEYFLDTEAQELEFEIARLRPRLTKEFFAHVDLEIGQLRFAVTKTKDMEDRLIEREAMQKVLLEGIDAYDKMQGDLMLAKERLARILQSKDKKATLLDMVEKNEINRSLLTLLDQNIASAHENEQKQAAEYMEKIRSAILKYITA